MIGSNDNGMFMPVAPAYMGGNCNNDGFGNDGWGGWLILFLLFGLFNGNGGWGGNGNNNQFPWLLNGQNRTDDLVTGGFSNAAVVGQLGDIQNGITTGFGNVQTSLCSGFAGVNSTVNAAQNSIAAQMYTNQIADMNQRFTDAITQTNQMNNLAAGLQNCCCENKAGLADVKYTLATEACATRNTDIQNTQAILTAISGGIQSIKDQMCQDKIDSKNDTIDQLRQELLYSRGQASQVAQTAAIEQYVRPTPAPAYIVANPYCNYNQTYGCACGA